MKVFNYIIFGLLLTPVAIIGLSSCKKLIKVDPPIDAVVGSEIYRTDATAASVLTGIYTQMSINNLGNLSAKIGVYGDELSCVDNGSPLSFLHRNDITRDDGQLFWESYYEYIFRANSAIEGLGNSNTLSAHVKKQLLGEAKFIRAFVYFYLVNLYGDVPLILGTDPSVSRLASRSSVDKVYQQIFIDLKESQDLLSLEFQNGDLTNSNSDRSRPSKLAATALLSRAYLYHRDWKAAEEESSKVIADKRFSLEPLNRAFLLESKEAIWQLQPILASQNTPDAALFVLKSRDALDPTGPDDRRPIYLSSNIYDKFEIEDQRKTNWTDTVQKRESGTGNILAVFPFANKYKAWLENQPRTEYTTVMRLAEMYLIRAEARAQQGDFSGAADDIFEIRTRAGLNKIVFSSLEDATNKILNERRAELFSEFGHRWFDLKRTGKLSQVMKTVTPLKGGEWQDYKMLFPILIRDLQSNPNLKGHQNPGYPSN